MRTVDPGRSRDYLTKAESSLKIAKFALGQHAYDAAVVNSIHSAINSLDALTASYLGKRSSGSHSDALDLIKGIFDEKEQSDLHRQFTSIIALKNTSEYEPDLMSSDEAIACVTRAERIFEKVKRKIAERSGQSK